jgi:5-formyltetrahydrofolate cyclo-ligase
VTSGISSIKSALRTSHRQRRASCDPMDPGFERQLTALPAWSAAETIGAYLGYGSEPRVTHLLASTARAGRTVLLPLLQEDGDLTWAPWDGDLDHLVRRGNVLEPAGPGSADAIARADIIITPALAVDRHGHRLGQGGGSFDRALARAEGALAIALVYDHDIVDELPAEEHDRRVDVVVTPTRTIAC